MEGAMTESLSKPDEAVRKLSCNSKLLSERKDGKPINDVSPDRLIEARNNTVNHRAIECVYLRHANPLVISTATVYIPTQQQLKETRF